MLVVPALEEVLEGRGGEDGSVAALGTSACRGLEMEMVSRTMTPHQGVWSLIWNSLKK